MMKSFIKGAGLLLLAMGSSAVIAVPITGDIEFVGTSSVTGTVVNFTGGVAAVSFADGDFAAQGVVPYTLGAPITPYNVATFNSLDFNTTPSFAGVPNLWNIAGFSFDLETVIVGTPTPAATLLLSGTGTLMRAGYDNTAYSWSYSSNGTVSFSAASAPVPEPGSLALLGLGLVGFAVQGYRRRRVQA